MGLNELKFENFYFFYLNLLKVSLGLHFQPSTSLPLFSYCTLFLFSAFCSIASLLSPGMALEARPGEASPGAPQEQVDNFEDSLEIILFQVKECYVYKIPPRRSAASYRADEWDINRWAWEGCLKVVTKGMECSIILEDRTTGELFAQAPVRQNHPLPVEGVIDSSRFFVLRIEDCSSGTRRHAFIGIGFRERSHAYDFQAALHDHMKFLNKKQAADEMAQEYESKPAVDYSLREGQTLHLQLKDGTFLSSGDKGLVGSPVESRITNLKRISSGDKLQASNDNHSNDDGDNNNDNNNNMSIPSIPPPPSLGPSLKALSLSGASDDDGDEDFGEFIAAT